MYQYNWNKGGCNSQIYFGYTEQTLEERFTHQSHKKHLREEHNISRIKLSELRSVEVLYLGRSKQELLVTEALFIADRKSSLNSQEESRDRVLNIF